MSKSDIQNIMGGVLAGGLSRRMGGPDKTILELGRVPLINRITDRLRPQVSSITISANGDQTRFSSIGYDIVADIIEGHAGPLAGVHALLEYAAQNQPEITHVATVAADTPFFPENFVAACTNSLNIFDKDQPDKAPDTTIVLAKSLTYRHPTFGLWPVKLRQQLAEFLISGETRKVMAFVQMHPFNYVEFEPYKNGEEIIDPFFNINEPADLQKAREIINLPMFADKH